MCFYIPDVKFYTSGTWYLGTYLFTCLGSGVAIEEVGRVHIPHLVQLGVADFTEKWAILFTEAPKELPDRCPTVLVRIVLGQLVPGIFSL
jgi:hypothetical protein